MDKKKNIPHPTPQHHNITTSPHHHIITIHHISAYYNTTSTRDVISEIRCDEMMHLISKAETWKTRNPNLNPRHPMCLHVCEHMIPTPHICHIMLPTHICTLSHGPIAPLSKNARINMPKSTTKNPGRGSKKKKKEKKRQFSEPRNFFFFFFF